MKTSNYYVWTTRPPVVSNLVIEKRWYKWFKEYAFMSDNYTYVRISRKGKDGKAIWKKL